MKYSCTACTCNADKGEWILQQYLEPGQPDLPSLNLNTVNG